jgi:branched-chain amino acid transport system substrate-binding protein
MKKNILVLVTLVIAVTMLVGCAAPSAPAATSAPAEGGEIWFAVLGAMTGSEAYVGIQQELGVRIAVEEINANGGINGKTLKYEVFDDQNIPNQAVIVAEKIVSNDKFVFVVAPTSSGNSRAAYPTLLTKDLPLISGINTADHITKQGFKNYLRISPSDAKSLVDLIKHMVEVGSKKVVIFHSGADTDRTNAEIAETQLKAAGVEVVAKAQFDLATEKDYTAHITNFMATGADSVLFLTEYNPAALFLKQASGLGWKGVKYFSLSGCSNPQLIEIAGKDAEGKLIAEGFNSQSAFYAGRKDPKVQAFVEKYKAASGGVLPGEWAAGGYDVVKLLAGALSNPEAADLRGNALVEWLRKNGKQDGIIFKVDGFDENGDNPAAVQLNLVVYNGEFVPVDDVK